MVLFLNKTWCCPQTLTPFFLLSNLSSTSPCKIDAEHDPPIRRTSEPTSDSAHMGCENSQDRVSLRVRSRFLTTRRIFYLDAISM
ncbi:hypothetical protein VIGAN_02196500 [Vigna angularis var. angularis]|uniref:Uncharacterized protein n=1 Tax=Vigna angularis var. angularis TaxID=157739 RepID=A0A0S3REY5_PHAAN|nr:hypothetical protein VIGAN_02196500 [Vigna angularis var. angularis]